jgi:hypothetical protein
LPHGGGRLTFDAEPISPYRLIGALMELADRRRTVVTHDSGNPRDQIVPFFAALAPLGYLGWGKSTPLGSGLGLAMGAKLARPDWLAPALGRAIATVQAGRSTVLEVMTREEPEFPSIRSYG